MTRVNQEPFSPHGAPHAQDYPADENDTMCDRAVKMSRCCEVVYMYVWSFGNRPALAGRGVDG